MSKKPGPGGPVKRDPSQRKKPAAGKTNVNNKNEKPVEKMKKRSMTNVEGAKKVRKPVPSQKAPENTPQPSKKGKKKNNQIPPEEKTRSKLKINKEPRKRPMKQDERDRAAEQMLRKNTKNEEEESAAEMKPLAPPRQPKSPYLRKLKRVVLAALTIMALVAICIVLSLTVFFKIDDISVEGKTKYNTDDIIASSLINKGDNLLLCNTSNGIEKIKNDYSYIEDVRIDKKLFNKIVITVKEADPASIVESDGKYIVLSKSGKIIEIADRKKYDVPTVLGAKLSDIRLSSNVKYSDENLKKYLDKILNALSKYNIGDVRTVDISNTSYITLVKSNGFKVVIGNFENVDYKLRTAANILKKNVKDTDKGTLDVSLASADGGKSYLRLGDESSVPQESQKKPAESSDKKQEASKTESSSQESSDEQNQETTEESQDTVEAAEPEYIPEDNTGGDYTDEGTGDTGDDYTDDGTNDTGEDYTDDGTDDTGDYYTDDGTNDTGEDYTDDGTGDTGGDYTDNTGDDGTGYDDGGDYTGGDDQTDDYYTDE